jgi:hypothetical protein
VGEKQADLQATQKLTRAAKKELLVEYEIAEKKLNKYIKVTASLD